MSGASAGAFLLNLLGIKYDDPEPKPELVKVMKKPGKLVRFKTKENCWSVAAVHQGTRGLVRMRFIDPMFHEDMTKVDAMELAKALKKMAKELN